MGVSNPQAEVSRSNGAVTPAAGVGGIVWLVAVVALLINALSLSASHLWVTPDASYYVELAGGIADHGDFRNEMFLVRPYGYPLMLAGIFRVFGSASPTALAVVQHAMLVVVAALATLIAWHASCRRNVALMTGLLTACSLQLVAYGNQVITEAMYAMFLTLSVYLVVRYHRMGGGKILAAASLCAGLSYLIRPTGILVIPICVLAVAHRAWKARSDSRTEPGHRLWMWLRPATSQAALACAPAAAIVAAMMSFNTSIHGTNISGLTSGLSMYQRLLTFDRFDSTKSEALNDIRKTLAEAKRRGAIGPQFDHTQWGPVWKAYEAVHGLSFGESGKIMARAANDLLRENRAAYFDHSVRSAYWTLMRPDATYRFQPGGAPGWVNEAGECKREQSAAIFDIGTYRPMLGQWLDPYEHYLPLETSVRTTTPLWTGIARWFHRNVETGPPLIGFTDTLYQEFVWLCLLGIGLSLLTRERMTWMLIAGVFLLHVAVFAILAAPSPRYIVPLHPLLLSFAALSIAMAVDGLVTLVRLVKRSRIQPGAVPAG